MKKKMLDKVSEMLLTGVGVFREYYTSQTNEEVK